MEQAIAYSRHRFVRYCRTLVVSLSVLALGVTIMLSSANAEEIFMAGNPNERIVSLPLSSTQQGKTIVVTVVGRNADAQNLAFSIRAPRSASVRIRGGMVRNAAQAQQVYRASTLPVQIYRGFVYGGNSSGSSSSSQNGEGQNGGGDDRDPYCGCLPESTIQAVLQASAPYLTRELFCGWQQHFASCSGSGGSSSSSSFGTDGLAQFTGRAFLESNRCNKSGKTLAAIEIDLSGVSASELVGTLIVQTKLGGYPGQKRASIKPKSDGGIFPGQPLLLAAPVMSFSDPVMLSRYRNARRISRVSIPDPVRGNSVGCRGVSCMRRPIGKFLRGGEGTFAVMNDGVGYSFCARLVRSRQFFNGYPVR